MALERNPAWRGAGRDEHHDGDADVRDMWRRFVWGAVWTMPVLLLSMGDALPVVKSIPPTVNRWLQFAGSLPVVFWCGLPLLRRAWQSARSMNLNMFSLIGIGVITAWAFSVAALAWPGTIPHHFQHGGGVAVYFESAAVITVLVLLGQVLEGRARVATGSAITALLDLAPRTATVFKDGAEIETPVDELRVGDVLRIRPGAGFPSMAS